jgi:uncharacterized protein YecE (DUF72 family)
MKFQIGTAGWSIPAQSREAFPADGSHLERYAARFSAVEINSSFYRAHRRGTYEKWAAAVGADFRFAVKLPKAISHSNYGANFEAHIAQFAGEISGLGDKLGVVLVQFPPSLAYHEKAEEFLSGLSHVIPCNLVCEPRHPSWFGEDADQTLVRLRIARVAADPTKTPAAGRPGGWSELSYYRLHGSPRIYYSDYTTAALENFRSSIEASASDAGRVWCIFDNTALGAATANALHLQEAICLQR